MDRAYTLLKGQLIVGSAPYSQDHFESIPAKVFVNLTNPDEKFLDGTPMYQYWNSVETLKFPITDRRCPKDIKAFYNFLVDVLEYLDQGKRVYLHCRGGHGRAGLTAACILLLYYDMSSEEALNEVYAAHQTRKVMKPKIRKLGAPQTRVQKQFVRKFSEYL